MNKMLIKVKDSSELEDLIQEIKKNKVKSNSIASSRSYIKALEEDRLYYLKVKNTYFFFEDMKDFYKCTYFFVEGDDVQIPEMDKRVILSIVSRMNKDNKNNIDIVESFGFKKYMIHERLTIKREHFVEKNLTCSICYAELNMSKEIRTILRDNFDLFTETTPNLDEIEKYINDKNLLIAINENNEIMGILLFSIKNNISNLEFIITLNEYRGNGIARNLISKWVSSVSKECALFSLWVREDNFVAKKLYHEIGFNSDGRVSYEFIK